MAKMSADDKKDSFAVSLEGKDIPILTLDHKWYRLLDRVGRENTAAIEEQLNSLIRRQGKLNSETKEIKHLKKRLMSEIVELAGESEGRPSDEVQDQIAQKKKLVEECNAKLEEYEDELISVPREIAVLNRELMLITMQHCYETMQDNTDEIEELEQWVEQIRIQIKKNLIRKQEMEAKNHEIYAYMHDVFGPEVVDLFDIRYNMEQQFPGSGIPNETDEDHNS